MPSQKALSHLSQDLVMLKLIHKYPLRPIKASKNLFADIVESIIGQQLSSRPADLIAQRFIDLFPGKDYPTLQQVLDTPDAKIRACGMSWSKASYIKNVAQAALNEYLDLKSLKKSPMKRLSLS